MTHSAAAKAVVSGLVLVGALAARGQAEMSIALPGSSGSSGSSGDDGVYTSSDVSAYSSGEANSSYTSGYYTSSGYTSYAASAYTGSSDDYNSDEYTSSSPDTYSEDYSSTGAAIECAPGCRYIDLADKECQEACNVVECNFDAGVCISRPPTASRITATPTSSDAPKSLLQVRFVDAVFNATLHDQDEFYDLMRIALAAVFEVPKGNVAIKSIESGSVLVTAEITGLEPAAPDAPSKPQEIVNKVAELDGEDRFMVGSNVQLKSLEPPGITLAPVVGRPNTTPAPSVGPPGSTQAPTRGATDSPTSGSQASGGAPTASKSGGGSGAVIGGVVAGVVIILLVALFVCRGRICGTGGQANGGPPNGIEEHNGGAAHDIEQQRGRTGGPVPEPTKDQPSGSFDSTDADSETETTADKAVIVQV